MRDIPAALKRLHEDIEAECKPLIMDELYERFRKDILRQAVRPFAAWYEQYLTNENAYWTAIRAGEEYDPQADSAYRLAKEEANEPDLPVV